MKSSELSIKTRSIPASLSFKGQATKHTTVKWIIQDGCQPSKKVSWCTIWNKNKKYLILLKIPGWSDQFRREG